MKKIHHFKQWTNEKVGRAKKSEMDEEIKTMISETDLQREYFERMHRTLSDYIHIYDKKIDTQEEKKIPPIYALGLLTINFGTIYPNDSAFGQALLQYGEAHNKLSENQSNFVINSRNGLLTYITNYLNEAKQYSVLKKKHDHRRLDLDEIQTRVKKSQKEKPQLIEELRVSQDKYEESLDELTKKMFDLNSCADKHLEGLKSFCLAELEYHQKATEILRDVFDSISDLKEENYERSGSVSTVTNGNSFYRSSTERSSFSDKSSNYQSVMKRDTSTLSSINERKSSLEYRSTTATIPESVAIVPAAVPIVQNQPQRESPTSINKPGLRQVRANFEFVAQSPDDLPMKVGDIINVLEEIDEGWWLGEMADGSGRTGMFPQNYTTEIKSETNPSLYPTLDSKSNNVTAANTNTTTTTTTTTPEYLPTDRSNYRMPSNPPSYMEAINSYKSPSMTSTNPAANPRNNTVTTATLQQKLNTMSGAGSENRASTLNTSSTRNMTFPGAAINASLKKSEVNSESTAKMGKCSTCGCEDYSLNLFKPPSCNNCFHKH